MEGVIFDIQRFSVHDGPGIRTTVFMKGCSLRCGWCHNPEGLRPEPQVQFFREHCIACGRCGGVRELENVNQCPAGALKRVGEVFTPDRLLEEVLADLDFYGADGGVTFSGGECLLQAEFVEHMLKMLKARGVTTAVDTCGNVPWENMEKALPCCDTWLYDIKCADPETHRRFTGSGNSRILENLEKLGRTGANIWIRVPVIPDFNDNSGEMERITQIAASTPGVSRVTLMPYHTLGKSKYMTLGLTPGYETDKAISQSRLTEFKDLFADRGLTVE